MITFTPLSESNSDSGSSSNSPDEHPKALAYLAEIDEVRILIDCGSPESFQLENDGQLDDVLREIAPTIDLVLLCHSTLSHLGLYAYARARFGLAAPCYSTLPTSSMGRLTVLEAILALRSERAITDAPTAEEDTFEHAIANEAENKKHFCIATIEEVDAAFEHITTLRYLQPTQLDGKCAGLTLTAYSAGHTLGGAVWKLRSPSSGTLLIALDWNHNRERHIDGTALISASISNPVTPTGPISSGGGIADAIRRPDVFITSMARASFTNSRRKDRDAALLDVIHNTIRSGHSVLIPIDASARLLELLVLLDQHWAFAYPHVRFPLCLVSSTGKEVIERARTLMEWMTKEWARTNTTETTSKDKDEDNEGTSTSAHSNKRQKSSRNDASQPTSPLDFQYLRIFSSIAAMDEVVRPSDAKVVLAWPPSLTHGPSRKLFARMAANEKDVIILTQHGQPGSLGRELYDRWERVQEESARRGKGKVGKATHINQELQVKIHSKVPLQGEELEAHLEAIKIANERAAQQKALLARSTRRLEADEDEGESSDEGSSEEDSDQEEIMVEEVGPDGQPGQGNKLISRRKIGGAIDNLKNDEDYNANAEISFDIYLKGKASRATTFFGTSTERSNGRYKTGIRFRMFPIVEKKRKVDTYGETLDVAKWLSRKRQLEALGGEIVEGDGKAQEDQMRKNQLIKDKEEAEKRKRAEPPSKFIVETVSVQVSCRIDFIDMEGLGDGRALKTIIPQLEPRRVILVESGNKKDQESLQKSLTVVRGMTHDIRFPSQGDVVEIGEFTSNYTVNLGEDVLSTVRFSNFQDYQVALLNAKINYRLESSIPMLEGIDAVNSETVEEKEKTNIKIKEEDATMEIEAQVSDEADTIEEMQNDINGISKPQPNTLFIGDLKLSSLKQMLTTMTRPSIPSEFIGQGTLVCGSGAFSNAASESAQEDVVTVRKEQEGEIVIEGNISRNFYSVRNAVYALHAQVTG